jgi:hypothetical protein
MPLGMMTRADSKMGPSDSSLKKPYLWMLHGNPSISGDLIGGTPMTYIGTPHISVVCGSKAPSFIKFQDGESLKKQHHSTSSNQLQKEVCLLQ